MQSASVVRMISPAALEMPVAIANGLRPIPRSVPFGSERRWTFAYRPEKDLTMDAVISEEPSSTIIISYLFTG